MICKWVLTQLYASAVLVKHSDMPKMCVCVTGSVFFCVPLITPLHSAFLAKYLYWHCIFLPSMNVPSDKDEMINLVRCSVSEMYCNVLYNPLSCLK